MKQEPETSARKVVLNHERQVVTYGWLWHASRVTLEIGQSGVSGAAWQRMASTLLTAFSVEAFLNHLGMNLLPDWNAQERKLSPIKKISRLAKELKVDLGPDNKRPISTVLELFSFRNSLAHGRTTELRLSDQIFDLSDDIDKQLVDGAPRTEWEERIRSDEFAVRAREDVETLFTALYAAMPEPKDGLFHTGTHFSAASVVPTD